MKDQPYIFKFLLFGILLAKSAGSSYAQVSKNILVNDTFENGLANWETSNPSKFFLSKLSDAGHNGIVRLVPGGHNTYMLLKNSDKYNGLSIEGDVLFPDTLNSYFGVIYNYSIRDTRNDYGCIYIKGNDNYLWANPHRNGNVSRELYNDYKIPIGEEDRIVIGQWKHFKVEVIDSIAHFYIGNMNVPKMTFPFYEFKGGKIGFEPRVDGSEVWLDNVMVKEINHFNYTGKPLPDIQYPTDAHLLKWEAVGPFIDDIKGLEKIFRESLPDTIQWKPFMRDERGCVVTGKVTAWANYRRIAYFKYTFHSDEERTATLYISSVNPLILWSGGKESLVKAEQSAWYDVGMNERHTKQSVFINLKKGTNVIYIKTTGQGVFDGYSGDGFFYRLL
jgi:hypothetical protein